MDCGTVATGQRFVAQILTHIDCQAQSIGAYGYGALADPGSNVSLALTGLLTIFVALFGLRMLIGPAPEGRDLAGDILRLGIVLTLATSWPAWRVLGYDLVMRGPGELSAAIGGASALPGSGGDLIARLQAADDGIVELTIYGTGRMTGGTNRSDGIGDSFRGVALTDQEGLANGRIAFLIGLIAPLAVVRLGAGLLLALAPVMAGLLLFAGTRDIFIGWLRALGAVALGAVALAVVQGLELAVLEPWLADALSQRMAQVLTPSMPTELAALSYSFALIAFAVLALVARIAFFGGLSLPRIPFRSGPGRDQSYSWQGAHPAMAMGPDAPSRAFVVAQAISRSQQREERLHARERMPEGMRPSAQASASSPALGATSALDARAHQRGDSSRRYTRHSPSGRTRDSK